MCPTSHRRSSGEATKTTTWISEAINGGSFRNVDLDTGTNGWASPPGNLFSLRSKTYLTKKDKSPAGEYLLSPAGVDWLKSPTRLDNVLSRSDNRVMHTLRVSQSLGSFVFAVNIQLPTGRDHHSLVMYFATDEPIQPGTLFHKFVNGSDAYRNSRFKIVSRLLKGPWLLKAAVEHYSACLLSNVLKVNYHRGDNYLEIDVDVGSSTIATAVLKLGLGYTTYATMDMGFVVEAQLEEELPEKLIGAVRICQMEMSSATVVSNTSRTMAESAPGSGI